jgi:2-dehydropantoate 2-reductase
VRHAILGAGAIGGLVGTALAHLEEDVTLVVRPEARARHSGMLQLERSCETIRAQVKISTGLFSTFDVLWIAVKGHQLLPALAVVSQSASIGAIVPLLNGIEHVDVLRSLYSHDQVVPATILVSCERAAPERFLQRSPFANLTIASIGEERLYGVRAGLEGAGFSVEFAAHEKTMLWRKLTFLAPLALVGAASGKDKQGIFGDAAWRNKLEIAVKEVCDVALADGAHIHHEEILVVLGGLPPTMRSSMQKDLSARLVPELDAVGGAILRAAQRHKIAVPVIQELVSEIAGRVNGWHSAAKRDVSQAELLPPD